MSTRKSNKGNKAKAPKINLPADPAAVYGRPVEEIEREIFDVDARLSAAVQAEAKRSTVAREKLEDLLRQSAEEAKQRAEESKRQ